VKVKPNSGTPVGEVILYYRDPLEAIKWLLSRPAFKEAMEFAPKHVWENSKREQRLYTDIFTGEWAHKMQVCRYRSMFAGFKYIHRLHFHLEELSFLSS
jgi:Plavaka transposase